MRHSKSVRVLLATTALVFALSLFVCAARIDKPELVVTAITTMVTIIVPQLKARK
jgi:hypothetical protein